MKIKISCLLILTLLLLTITGCKTEQKETESDASVISSSESSEDTSTDPLSFLPAVNYNGEEIVFLCESDITFGSVYTAELDSTLINDAVYNRNVMVQDKLGVVIKAQYGSSSVSCLDMLRQSISSGLDSYDVVMPYMPAAATMALDGNLYDLNDIPEINLQASYWDHNANEDLSIGGKLYFTVGAMTYSDRALTLTYIFNKDVVKDKNLEDPYTLVNDGKWTMDKMLEMSKQVTADSDGNGIMNYKDTWGLFMNNYSCASVYYLGTGERIIKKDNNDLPVLSLYTDRGVNVFDKIMDIYTDKSATIKIEAMNSEAVADGYKDCYEAANAAFADKRALFKTMNLSDLTPLGQYEVNFGILPYPKYDENQTEYFSPVSLFYVTPVCIPKSNKEPQKAAYVVEAMNAASVNTVEKSYYDVLLKLRQIQDKESEQMLDIIFGNRVYDLSILYNWGGSSLFDYNGCFWFMNQVADSGENTFASKYESLKESIETGIQSTIDAFNN